MGIDKTYDYCVSKAIPDGSNLYYATIFDSVKNKTIIITLHAFLYELSEIIHECSDPGIARIKLKWWQEEIERLSNNEARHPVTQQMQECIIIDHKLIIIFNSIIECFNQFIFVEQPDSIESILSLYKSTSGEISYQCGMQLNQTKTDPLNIMRELAALIHFIGCLQQPRTYINETRCIIPVSTIEHANLLELGVDTANKHMRQKEVFSPLFLDLKIRLDKTYQALNRKENHNLQHVLILNRLAYKTCDEILRDGCNLLDTNVSITPVRKLWIACWTHFTLK